MSRPPAGNCDLWPAIRAPAKRNQNCLKGKNLDYTGPTLAQGLETLFKRVESTDNFATGGARSAPCAPDRHYAWLRLASSRHCFGGQLFYLSFEPSGHRAGTGERPRLRPAAHRNCSGNASSQLPRKKRRAERSCARPSRIAVASLSCRSWHAHPCIALLTKAVRHALSTSVSPAFADRVAVF